MSRSPQVGTGGEEGQRPTSSGELIGVALVAEWVATGGNVLAFKFALESFPPVLMMGIRLLAAGTTMLVPRVDL